MSKIEITRTELVWPGKYDDEGNLTQVERVNLPFQVIETVNETRATREAKTPQLSFFDYWEPQEGDTFVNAWTSYRTRRDRTPELKTDPHVYEQPGTYRIMVKVIDIFGNDTSRVFEVQVA